MTTLTPWRHSLLLIPFLLLSCATGNPEAFLQKGFEARGDSQRHQRVLDSLCSQPGLGEEDQDRFCLEALRVQEMNGDRTGAERRSMELCQRNRVEACLIWTRLASPEDPRIARETLSRACDEDPAYCIHSARLEEQQGNLAEALKRARRGCVAGHAVACRDQGALAVQQDDLSSAALALEKACQADVEGACFRKTLVSRMMGKATDEEMERLCKTKEYPLACDLQEVDVLKALEKDWWDRADRTCRKEGGESCYRVALDQYFRPGGRSLARFRFRKDCEQSPEHSRSCFMSLLISRPLGFRSEDREALRKLCAQQVPEACAEIAEVTAEPTVSIRRVAPEELASACEQGGRPESCEAQARNLFRSGDVNGAEEFMLKACRLSSEDACTWLGIRRQESQPPRIAEAREFFRKACLNGSVLGCERLLPLLEPNHAEIPPHDDSRR